MRGLGQCLFGGWVGVGIGVGVRIAASLFSWVGLALVLLVAMLGIWCVRIGGLQEGLEDEEGVGATTRGDMGGALLGERGERVELGDDLGGGQELGELGQGEMELAGDRQERAGSIEVRVEQVQQLWRVEGPCAVWSAGGVVCWRGGVGGLFVVRRLVCGEHGVTVPRERWCARSARGVW